MFAYSTEAQYNETDDNKMVMHSQFLRSLLLTKGAVIFWTSCDSYLIDWFQRVKFTVFQHWFSLWRLKSPVSRLFTQPFIQAQIKENIKAQCHWPLWGEFTGDRWIPRTKGQWRGKCFHLMTSSCDAKLVGWRQSVKIIYSVICICLTMITEVELDAI